MKRLFTSILAVMLSVMMLTGCGGRKSREQKARNEIRDHMVAEAREDGVDLNAMLEQEAAESLARTQAREEEREARTQSKEELDAYYDPLLQNEYDALIAATTAQETMKHGDRYNELIVERNTIGEESGVTWGGHSNHIKLDPAAYRAKAMFLASKEYAGYDEYHMYHTGTPIMISDPPDKLMLIYANENENHNYSELVFVREDFSVTRLDLSAYFDSDLFIDLTMVSDSVLEVCAVGHGDWIWYLFDISSPEGTLVANSTDYDEASYSALRDEMIPYEEKMGDTADYIPYWENTMEELNDMVVDRTFGVAADPYR